MIHHIEPFIISCCQWHVLFNIYAQVNKLLLSKELQLDGRAIALLVCQGEVRLCFNCRYSENAVLLGLHFFMNSIREEYLGAAYSEELFERAEFRMYALRQTPKQVVDFLVRSGVEMEEAMAFVEEIYPFVIARKKARMNLYVAMTIIAFIGALVFIYSLFNYELRDFQFIIGAFTTFALFLCLYKVFSHYLAYKTMEKHPLRW